MKTVKSEVAKFMLSHKGCPTVREWHQFISSTHHPVRVKEVGPNGKVNLNFSGNDGWIGQTDWLFNYQQECIRRFISERERLEEILPPEQLSNVCSTNSQVKSKELTDFERWLEVFFRGLLQQANEGKLNSWKSLEVIARRFRSMTGVAIPDDYINQCYTQQTHSNTK